jgi:hypothetical protein
MTSSILHPIIEHRILAVRNQHVLLDSDLAVLYGVQTKAIAHKLLRTMFFMLKRREHYRDSTTDYEALAVQRNAPRWIKALTKFGFIPDPA